MEDERDPVVELSAHECLALLRTADIGRLAMSRLEHPEVFPVNFIVDHGSVVFRTATGTKLDAIARDHHVTFEADGYDAASGDAWSVIIKGDAAEVEAIHDRAAAAELPLFPWQATPKPRVVRILPVEMTGRRFHAARHATPDRPPSAPHTASE